jgi:hypothetical protein
LSEKDKSTAARFLEDWIARARSSGIRMLQRFANTLGFHRSSILAYYDCRLTTVALRARTTRFGPCNAKHKAPEIMNSCNRSRAMPMSQSCGGSGGVRPEMVAFE